MSRKTEKENIHEFTNQIRSTKRKDLDDKIRNNNWDERKAKAYDSLSCKCCRYFYYGCSRFIGEWHKTCDEFEWD